MSRRAVSTATVAALVVGGAAVCAAPAAAAPVEVRITPNPAYASEPFEGWGTSLAWFADATGGYPDEVRQDLVDKLFGDDGLNLNIARYNIGGGNASNIPDYMRLGGAVPGWWNPNLGVSDAQGAITSNYGDRHRYAAAWDPDNPAHYDFNADANQRWWIDAIKDRVTRWEAFSNSPPYFLTNSGYVSGGVNKWAEQMDSADVDPFAGYLLTVAEHVEAAHGISFDSIEPFNEPASGYWFTDFGPGGLPKGYIQEGAFVGPTRQSEVVAALDARLQAAGTTTDAKISAMDETNPGLFVDNWNKLTASAKGSIDQLNVHTYNPARRPEVRDIAKSAGKPLWMSEVEESWDTGVFNTVNMSSGLGLAGRITDDLRELEPSAWVLWQPLEDAFRQQAKVPTSTSAAKGNWGSIFIDFDCNADGDSVRRLAANQADPSCKVQTNSKYNTMRNFTHYIDEGDRLIAVDNGQTTAAVDTAASTVTLVHSNTATTEREIVVDLSRFASIGAGAGATPIVTTQSTLEDTTSNALQVGAEVAVDAATKTVRVVLPPRSVSTLVIDGVSGVADTAPAFRDGETYELKGEQSGKLLTADAAAMSIRSAGASAATPGSQRWTVRSLSGEGTNRHRFALQAADGRLLSATGGVPAATTATLGDAATDPTLQWIANTSNGRHFSLLSVSGERVLGVSSQGTADGTAVVLSAANEGRHQRWIPVELSPADLRTNVALTSTTASTYAESGFGADRTKNGSTTDKGWSNWRGTTKNPQDTLTYTFASAATVDSARLHFYKDGATNSWPQSVTVEYRTPAGAWVALPSVSVPTPAGGTAPVVEVPLGGVTATALRTVLTAQPGIYMVVSEVQIFSPAS